MEIDTNNIVTGSEVKTTMNGTHTSPPFRHHLPQMANLTRNSKIAQSKASAKLETSTQDEATLLVEDTGKVVKMNADLKQAISVQDQPKEEPEKPLIHPKERAKAEARSQSKVESEKAKTESSSTEPAEKDEPEPITSESTVKPDTPSSPVKEVQESSVKEPTEIQKTPVSRSRKKTSTGEYKNIFEVTPVEGKRQRKPKILDIDENSPKSTASSTGSVKSPDPKPASATTTPVTVFPEKPADWQKGDLLWAKVAGHPWWPCMIANDPYEDLWTKMKGKSRIYHVQFFGNEGERGWVGGSSVMEFKGKEKYDEHVKLAFQNAKKGEKIRLEKLYREYPGRNAAWLIAITQTEEALPLSREDRIEQYSFVYIEKPKKNTPKVNGNVESKKKDTDTPKSKAAKNKEAESENKKKRKRGEEDVTSPEAKPPRTKRQKVDSATPSRSKSTDGSFEVFCSKHIENMKEEHPDFDDKMINECLQQQWLMMSQKQKSRYKSKFSTEEAEEETPATKATSKRRSKVKEVEEKSEDEIVTKKNKQPATEWDTQSTSSELQLDTGSGFIPESKQDVKPKLKRQKSTSEESTSDIQDEDKTSSSRTQKHLCLVCEDTGELIECEGVCNSYFHKSCIEMTTDLPFKCEECSSGVHTCFSCKKKDDTTKRCSVNLCGKFYHEECINKLNHAKLDTNRGFVCPLHVCATCSIENSKGAKARQGRLMRCVRCPTAYHTGDFCIAAGSEQLPGYNIVCSKHFQPMKTQKYHTHINVSWCFVCNLGGSLICCESCPASFHAECLKINPPEGSWYCHDCSHGKQPLYGDIVWVKLGSYRWWPAEICHSKNVPHNIQEKTHQVGEFPVHFFGTNDYFWIHKGRAFCFQDGDKYSKESSTNRHLAKIFAKGVQEATEAYQALKALRANKEQILMQRSEKKPAPYKFIKTNVPVGSVQIMKPDLATVPKCECSPDQETPCSSDTDCLNRMLMYECHPAVCPCGEKCNNQRFQKRQYPDSEPFKTEGRGWGLRTNVDIKKGQFVNEYVGELIDEEEVKRRIDDAHENNISNFYMLTLDKNRIIDAGPKGNLSRFMNHSCAPNCETQKWTANGDVRVGLFALCDIPAGSELTFNYNLECLGNDKTKCNCGADLCSGFLGVRPKSALAASVARSKKRDEKKKRRRHKKTDLKKEHEDECFRCGEGGELVMCDRGGCPKVYHLHCLKLSKPPHGKWDCPWHHCDECGKSAVTMCTECPNSFCQNHTEGNINFIDNVAVCSEHDEVTSSSCASSDVQSDTEDGDTDSCRQARTKAMLKENLVKKRNLNKSEGDKDSTNSSKKSRKSSASSDKKNVKGGKSGTNPLAVAPMFDDSDEDFSSDLVIDIPNIL